MERAMINNIVLSELQEEHMNGDMLRVGRERIHESWFQEDTVDFWRHNRMYATISESAKFYKDSTWVSIGDGRYGLDSCRLKNKFGVNVLPTDISENMLREGKERGLFDKYSVENAEDLSFDDNSFDVVFCKEAFHHCPRPIIALYEMIRVAREVVILIEPVEQYDAVNVRPDFEGSGNYVYSLNNREVNKIVHGMDLGGMAVLTFNDVHEQGVEFEEAIDGNPVFDSVKQKIADLDMSGKIGLTTTVIFKNKIDPGLKEAMLKQGFIFPTKYDNPVLAQRNGPDN